MVITGIGLICIGVSGLIFVGREVRDDLRTRINVYRTAFNKD